MKPLTSTSSHINNKNCYTSQNKEDTSLHLKEYLVIFGTKTLLCDVSKCYSRSYILPSIRRKNFKYFHNISYPVCRATDKLISNRFVWPKMNTDMVKKKKKNWTQTCVNYQKSKVNWHTKSPPDEFTKPGGRVTKLHIVRPLPEANGHGYLLTIIDLFTRWPLAFPLKDISAQSISKSILNEWINVFGCPSVIRTDRGAQWQFFFLEFT